MRSVSRETDVPRTLPLSLTGLLFVLEYRSTVYALPKYDLSGHYSFRLR